jgi:hypothetical protein
MSRRAPYRRRARPRISALIDKDRSRYGRIIREKQLKPE